MVIYIVRDAKKKDKQLLRARLLLVIYSTMVNDNGEKKE